MYRWHFNRVRPADKARDPVQGEFFASDAIGNAAEALVREGIQNSLDARGSSDTDRVVVRIRLSRGEKSLPFDTVQPFLEGLRPHLEAPGNSLRTIPKQGEPCPYLLFEDFGTTGLTGDETEWHIKDGAPTNHFYHFFRAEGRSGKAEEKRGRWGVGKHVFLRASRINTVFGLTVRADDSRKLLMGMTVLKSHDVAGERYGPDGWFGVRDAQDESKLVLPIEDEELVSRFSNAFNLIRKREPGLSIVVPWCELDSEAGGTSIITAVVKGYFWPILRGQLEVWVEVGEQETLLDSNSLMPELQRLTESTCDMDPAMMAKIGLAQWAITAEEDHFVRLDLPPDGSWKWSDQVFPPGILEEARARFLGGEKLAVRVPIEITEIGYSPQRSHFDVFLERQGREESFRPVYIRNGIIIPDVRKSRIPKGVISIVVADDGPIATFLGDAENPSHTQWQREGANFRGKYDRGPTLLNYVIQSVAEITNVLLLGDRQQDQELLKDIFWIPAPAVRPEPQPGPQPDIPVPPKAFPPALDIRLVEGGFSVGNGIGNDFHVPSTIRIHAAYDLRRGNPFRKYRREDFDFNDSRNIRFDLYGAQVLWKLGNAAHLRVDIKEFRITVKGFDRNRDLRVRAEIVEGAVDGSEA